MKICTKCLIEKPLSEFSINKNKKDGLNYQCRSCQSKYHRQHYLKNKEKYIKQAKTQRRKSTDILREIKKKCSICDENHPATLDFHHIDPSVKEIDLARAANNGWSKNRLLKEIKKCIIVCRNCHAKIHWERHRNKKVNNRICKVQ
jgi:hypothetical protein